MNKENRYKADVDYSLYLVADSSFITLENAEKSISEAIEGGVTVIQLRAKDISTAEFYNMALKIKMFTDSYNIPLIINDRVDVAMAADTAGVHVGQDDMPAREVRKLIGENKILGVSVSNVKEALEAERNSADYLGAGAMFLTRTKSDAKYVGINELEKIKLKTKIPVVAIGGININNAEEIFKAGADGIAVVSAILGEKDMKEAALKLKKLKKI
ncbi:thiamine phosphate synthase [Sebaldella sp. S0638]|uniref:thiamine phosphate synthase n=1 Tax=Sebaldella sp. S0638 TaxID=2957809 RepID=UPI0020A221D0|nr:thiamine phosphate synthase [Sebaldella sp. S0638]MCP1224609.1 thiamine phosphate synthase [Sebaldella sp. S0638]